MMRRTVEELKKNKIEFSEDFDENKKILGKTMPSKKLRNRIAGLAARLKEQERKETPKINQD